MGIKIKVMLIICMILALAGCKDRSIPNKKATEKETGREYEGGIQSRYIAQGREEGGNNYYVFYMNERGSDYISAIDSIPSLYIVDIHLKYHIKDLDLSGKEERYIKQEKVEEFFLNLYSIETGEIVKVIDVKKRIEEKKLNVQPIRIYNTTTLKYNGNPCFAICVENIPETVEDGRKNTERYLLVDLETEELYETDQVKYSLPTDNEYGIFYYSTLRENNGLKEGTFIVGDMNYWEGASYVTISMDNLPKGSAELYRMFPDLQEKLEAVKELGGEPRLKVFLTDSPTAEEVLKLFLPDGQEINFDNIVVPGEKSIDGQEHKVSSFEEYKSYLKPIEWDYDLVSPIIKRAL